MAGLGKRKKDERRKKLLAEITRDPGIMIRDLAEKLNVSRETIRRDFDALCEEGLLQRRYGGGAFLPMGNPLSFEARQGKHVGVRKAIVRKAHDLLQDGQVAMLGPGTTALLFAAEMMTSDKKLTIITNGVQEAVTLAKNDNLRVVLAPGEVDRLEGFAWGHDTTEFISRFNADMAVFFADGLAASGVSEADPRTAGIVTTMLRQSERNMLLIDHFRFDHQGLQKICSLSDLDLVVSDRAPSRELQKELSSNGVIFHCA
jgi:DeoR/GlpR family transcriptional regulator of sugar metabolism